MRFAFLFLGFYLSVAAYGTSAVVVDMPCSSAILLVGDASGGSADYAAPTEAGLVMHFYHRARPADGSRALTMGPASHMRFSAVGISFKGLPDVIHAESMVDADAPRSTYYTFPEAVSPTQVNNTMWNPSLGHWVRYGTASYPLPADGISFTVRQFDAITGATEQETSFRWQFLPQFICPWDRTTYRDVFLLRTVSHEEYDASGQRKMGRPQRPRFAYFARGRGMFYAFSASSAASFGDLAAPDEAGIHADNFHTMDRHWPEEP